MNLVLLLVSLLSALAPRCHASGTTYTWHGANGARWADATNWRPTGNPGSVAGDNAFITGNGGPLADFSGNIDTLFIGGNGTLTVSNQGAMSVLTEMIIDSTTGSPTIRGTGDLVLNSIHATSLSIHSRNQHNINLDQYAAVSASRLIISCCAAFN